MSNDYETFLTNKSQPPIFEGFDPIWMPDFLFDFQSAMVDWSLRKGRGLLLEDCGLGKTPQYLVWAENVARHTNGRVLIVTPLAVSAQTVREGEKFGIEAKRSVDGKPAGKITVTNYEKLHLFDRNDYVAFVGDESSAIKDFKGERQKIVTEFMREMRYRLLCTATAAPNDYIELGTSAEALGELGRMDMLARFFKNDENSMHPIWWGARWRFKRHGERDFWRWVCSWSRALRKPSDMGFDDARFVLPPLIEREHVVDNGAVMEGFLFPIQATTLRDQREERRITTKDRCEKVAELVEHHPESVVWCHLNDEGDLLEQIVDGAVQVSGSDSDERKEEAFKAFSDGQIKRLITKPKIGGWGLNWQHCAHTVSFPSHSFEGYYQSLRRFYRFGQTRPVTSEIVTTKGELGVLKNLQRKADAADKLFDQLVLEMNNALRISRTSKAELELETPSWL